MLPGVGGIDTLGKGAMSCHAPFGPATAVACACPGWSLACASTTSLSPGTAAMFGGCTLALAELPPDRKMDAPSKSMANPAAKIIEPIIRLFIRFCPLFLSLLVGR